MHYDRKGNPIDWQQYLALHADPGYKILAQTQLPDGVWVSTVWLGLDHAYGDGPPLIFETMVFSAPGNYSEVDMVRYSTEEEALEGHEKVCEIYQADD